MLKRKISILINSISAGGAERVVSLLLHELNDDLDIHLVLLNNTIEYKLPAGQKIFCLQQPSHENGLVKIMKLPLLALRYKKYCRKNNINVSLSFLKRANYINCLSRIMGMRGRIIISERTYLSSYLKFLGRPGNISGSLTRKLYPKADLVITNAALIKNDLEENFNIHTKFRVIHNPVDLASIQQAAAEDADPSLFSEFTFISVGGFRGEKNYELMIEAFDAIKDLNCSLLFVGKGEEEIKLKNKVKEKHLESRIHFAGFDNNPYKYLSRASCFVLSSDFEGFPNSIQEALACKLPVISTDCKSGPREILAPATDFRLALQDKMEIAEYGILVPVNNVLLMAQAMRKIFTDNVLRERLKEKAFVRANDFEVSKIAAEFKQTLISEQVS